MPTQTFGATAAQPTPTASTTRKRTYAAPRSRSIRDAAARPPITRPTPHPAQRSPNPRSPALKDCLREEDLGDVEDPAREHHDRPDDQHARERLRVRARRRSLRPGRSSARVRSGGRSAAAAAGISATRTAEIAKVTAFTPVGERRARGRDEDAAEERARARPSSTRRAGAARSPSASSSLADEVRQPGEDGRPEEGVADAGDHGERDDRRGGVRRTAAPRTRRAGRGRRRSSAPSARAGRRAGRGGAPMKTAGQDVRDQQLADPPARVRAVVDVDLERDDGEPVADLRSRTSPRRAGGSDCSRATQRVLRVLMPSHLHTLLPARAGNDPSRAWARNAMLLGRADRDADRGRRAEAG